MKSFLLWAAVGLAAFLPTIGGRLGGCPDCECCGCCDAGRCECASCTCACCDEGCQTTGAKAGAGACCGSGGCTSTVTACASTVSE